MNRFTVVWTQEALDQLAQAWLAASERDAISKSAELVGELLAKDPIGGGEHLSEGIYRSTIATLRILYTIHEDDRLVRIEAVRPA